MRIRLWGIVFLLLSTLSMAQPLAPDPNLIIGKLPNGLSYYIRKNAQPKDRAELRLVVNAGSAMEDDDQKGLAHFLEHMLFKGTARFPGLEVVNFLEKVGMQFGPDVNAFTSFDETAYILKLPTTDPAILQKGLEVLVDWAQSATLAEKDVLTEAGVIVEEERLRDQNANGRVNKQLVALLTNDSRYSQRRPIGDMNVIRGNPTAAMKRFYTDWYRPDLMAVVAVGDFDPKAMQATIQKEFAGLKNPPNPKPRPSFEIKNQSGDAITVVADPEFPNTLVRLYGLRPVSLERTQADLKARVLDELFTTLLSTRLDDLANSANPPFVNAGAGIGGFVRTAALDVLSAQVREGQEKAALEALITELRRAKLGFTPSELTSAKAKLLATYQKRFNERDKQASDALADAYLDAFLSGSVPIDIETEFNLVKGFLEQASAEQVLNVAKGFLAGPKDILAIRPQKSGLAPLSDADLKAVLAQAEAKAVQAYQDRAVQAALMEQLPQSGSIAQQNKQKEFTQLVLSNGVKVLYKATDYKADEVLFRAYSPGGASLYPDADYAAALVGAAVVDQSGIGKLSRADLQKVLAGKQVGVSPFVGERSEGMQGQSSTKDLETLFQLIHLYFTQPRADEEIFNKERQTRLEALQNRALNPISALQDVLDDFRLPGTVRSRPLMAEALQSLSRERALALYKERFGDASDFTFVLVGNFGEAKLLELVQRYLASLPSKNTKETWKNLWPAQAYAKTTKTVYKGKDERGYAVLYFAVPMEFSAKNSVVVAALRNLLDIRNTEELREKLGGVYSAGVSGSLNREPNSETGFLIQFSLDPKKTDELVKAALAVLEEVKTKGVSADNMTKVREQLKRAREEQLRTNAFWVSRLLGFAQYPDSDPNDTTGYFDLVNGLTSDDLQQAAQLIFKDNYLQAVLLPESMQK